MYNFTTSAEVQMSWHDMIEIGRDIIIKKVPLGGAAWYVNKHIYLNVNRDTRHGKN